MGFKSEISRYSTTRPGIPWLYLFLLLGEVSALSRRVLKAAPPQAGLVKVGFISFQCVRLLSPLEGHWIFLPQPLSGLPAFSGGTPNPSQPRLPT